MYISTKKILLQREEVRRNYRPTYLILLPRERHREQAVDVYTDYQKFFFFEKNGKIIDCKPY